MPELDGTTTTPDPVTPHPIADTGSLSEHEAEYHEPKRLHEPKRSSGQQADHVEPTAAGAVPESRRPSGGDDLEGPTDAELAAQPNLRYDKAPRHRAKSQQAGPEDVPRIRELTKKLKDAEARIQSLTATPREAPVSTAAPARAPVSAPSAPSTSGFTEAEPTIEAFANEADPYAAWTRSLAKYDRRKEAFEERSARERDEATQSQARARADWDQRHATYQTQANEFVKAHPDYDAKLAETIAAHGGQALVPAAPYHAILAADNGPAIVYHLLTHPVELTEVQLLFSDKPATPQLVATATRWLTARLAAGSTGAAPTPLPQNRTPKPPTPVRTGPMKTGQEPPGDGASLSDHEAFYTRKRR